MTDAAELARIVATIRQHVRVLEAFTRNYAGCGGPTLQGLQPERLKLFVAIAESLPTVTPAHDGELLMAWVVLGATVENALKLFFIIYESDYEKDPKLRKQQAIPPDELNFEYLRQLVPRVTNDYAEVLVEIQSQRNLIHPLGTDASLLTWVDYCDRLRNVALLFDVLAASLPDMSYLELV